MVINYDEWVQEYRSRFADRWNGDYTNREITLSMLFGMSPEECMDCDEGDLDEEGQDMYDGIMSALRRTGRR